MLFFVRNYECRQINPFKYNAGTITLLSRYIFLQYPCSKTNICGSVRTSRHIKFNVVFTLDLKVRLKVVAKARMHLCRVGGILVMQQMQFRILYNLTVY